MYLSMAIEFSLVIYLYRSLKTDQLQKKTESEKNYINEKSLVGKYYTTKTFWPLIIFILIYFYVIHSGILSKHIDSLGFYIFADILGTVLSFFIMASIWRSANNYIKNKIWPILSKIFVIGIVTYSLYKSYFMWMFPDLINNIF